MYKKSYKKLENFANKLGYKVVDSDCDSWHYQSKIICNNVRRKPDNRIIYLSHECGHAKVFHEKRKEYEDFFPGFSQGGIKNKVSTLEQEVLAWEEGFKLLKNLNIPFNIRNFAKIKTTCLQGYL